MGDSAVRNRDWEWIDRGKWGKGFGDKNMLMRNGCEKNCSKLPPESIIIGT